MITHAKTKCKEKTQEETGNPACFVERRQRTAQNRRKGFSGLREDSVQIRAEIVEIGYKDSVPKGELTLNWESKPVVAVDRGRRLRAILALGSQDIGDARGLTPLDPGVEILGCSSDHTIVDVTECPRRLRYGDVLAFHLTYSTMMHALSGKHVSVVFTED